jgi:arabinofuranosyltransferase
MGFVALLLAGTLSNRTFLTWTSSGLETAMFNFLVTWWLFTAVTFAPSRKRVVLLSCVSALLALTRPDGLLFVVIACALALVHAHRAPDSRGALRAFLISVSPLAVVIAHQAWRLSFYGAWLPNTYYAKVVAPWPASGARYAASYVLEYCLWFPVLALMVMQLRRGTPRASRAMLTKLLTTHVFTTAAAAAVIIHLAYYTLIVGGDHFEYRVYSYTVPLVFVALAAALNQMAGRVRTAVVVSTASILLAAPVPWTHWSLTHQLNTREQTYLMFVPVSQAWPQPVKWYARSFDRLQQWLTYRLVCTRHQEHKVFWRYQIGRYPTRAQGSLFRDDFPVISLVSVGMGGWVYPHANVIDVFGLNDYVIARTPYPNVSQRKMAHGRRPPDGYVESYQPNLLGRGVLTPREQPLTASRIACLEHYWRDQLPRIQRGESTAGDALVCD